MHRKIEMAVAIALVDDVSAILGDSWADAGFNQFLDLVDYLSVRRIFIDMDIRGKVDAGCASTHKQRRAAHERVEQRLEDERFEVGPGNAWRGGHRDEVATIENAFDHAAVEQGFGKR